MRYIGADAAHTFWEAGELRGLRGHFGGLKDICVNDWASKEKGRVGL